MRCLRLDYSRGRGVVTSGICVYTSELKLFCAPWPVLFLEYDENTSLSNKSLLAGLNGTEAQGWEGQCVLEHCDKIASRL